MVSAAQSKRRLTGEGSGAGQRWRKSDLDGCMGGNLYRVYSLVDRIINFR